MPAASAWSRRPTARRRAASSRRRSRRCVRCGIAARSMPMARPAMARASMSTCRSRFFDDAIAASGHKVRPNRLAVGMIFLPRTDLEAQETLPHDRRGRDHRRGLHHLWLAPGAGRRVGDRRQGAAHAARDRADHDRRAAARRSVARRVRKAALSRPPPDREKGDRGADRRLLRRAACRAARSSTRGCSSPRASPISIPT